MWGGFLGKDSFSRKQDETLQGLERHIPASISPSAAPLALWELTPYFCPAIHHLDSTWLSQPSLLPVLAHHFCVTLSQSLSLLLSTLLPALLVRKRVPTWSALTREAVSPAAITVARATEADSIRATSHGLSWPARLPSLPAATELALVTLEVVAAVLLMSEAAVIVLNSPDPGAATVIIVPGVVAPEGFTVGLQGQGLWGSDWKLQGVVG